jgi:hypothetical protein
MRPLLRLLLPLASLALGCSKPVPPTIVPDSATVTSADAQGLHVSVTLTATNPNRVDLPIQDVTAHVVLAGTLDLGTTTLQKAVTLPAGQPTKLDLPFSVPWTDLLALAGLVASPAPVLFTVDGNVDLGGDLVHVSVPFTMKGTMTHEQLMGAASRSMPGLMR